MKDILSQRNIMLAAALLLVGFALYQLFWKTDEAGTALQQAVGPESETPSRNVAQLLSSIRSISIDESFFSDPVFQSLQDFTTPIAPEPQGRQNPFAPIGQTSGFSSQATSTDQNQ